MTSAEFKKLKLSKTMRAELYLTYQASDEGRAISIGQERTMIALRARGLAHIRDLWEWKVTAQGAQVVDEGWCNDVPLREELEMLGIKLRRMEHNLCEPKRLLEQAVELEREARLCAHRASNCRLRSREVERELKDNGAKDRLADVCDEYDKLAADIRKLETSME